MEKAYDFKKLIELSQKYGGPGAEKMLKANWKAIKEWGLQGAKDSVNTADDIFVPLAVTGLDPIMNKVLDQVDGEIGN